MATCGAITTSPTPSDSAMEQPVCWITNAIDRSPAELVWVESKNPAWEPLRGALLCLSYGNGKIFVVPHEVVGGQMQGGVCALPIPPLPTGVMRGRFHPGDGQLYTCGLFAWAGDRTQPGGFYRVRATGKPMFLPIGLSARTSPPGNHLHRTARPENCLRPGTLHGQDLVAEADRQLRLRPPRRTTGPDHQGHALRRWTNRLARNPRPAADLVHGNHLRHPRRERRARRGRDSQYDSPPARLMQ